MNPEQLLEQLAPLRAPDAIGFLPLAPVGGQLSRYSRLHWEHSSTLPLDVINAPLIAVRAFSGSLNSRLIPQMFKCSVAR